MPATDPAASRAISDVLRWGAEGYDYLGIMALIRAVGCACVSHDDAAQCARFRWGDGPWREEGAALGMMPRCDCTCHDLWQAWVEEGEET